MVEQILLKCVFVLVIFACGVAGGLAPLRIKGGAGAALNVARGNAFAGGVFLGAGLLHLLSDGIENFGLWRPAVDFPFPMLLAGAAVVFVLLTDQLGHHREDKHGQRRSTLLLIVLSIHSVIAGAALGLEGSLLNSVALFIAIIAHKGAAGFALGTALISEGLDRARHMRIILGFAVTTPIGIALGAFLGSEMAGGEAEAFEAVFDSLAAGTFFYIALTDMFSTAFRDASGKWGKLVLAAAGFALMALIAIWA